MKIDNKFLLNLKSTGNCLTSSIKLNSDLFKFVRKYCKKENLKIGEYMNNLILIHALHESKGLDFFEILEEDL